MANDIDNNFLVSGVSSDALIATDYSDGAHFQVMKLAFGNSGEATRVESSSGLPVNILNSSLSVAVTSMPSTAVTGSVAISNPSVAVTGSNFGIRALTGGDPTAATAAPSADFVRVVGYSGGWAVGVTATNFGIRALTAGNITSGVTQAGADYVRVVGASGAYPIAVMGTSFNIRGLSASIDFVSIGNTLNIVSGNTSPYDGPAVVVNGLQTRLLRASTGGIPFTSSAGLVGAINTLEDTVRVVGLSGAYPVYSVAMGKTGNVPIALKVDNDGNLFVNLASGTIGITASITGFTLGAIQISGVSLANVAVSKLQALQVHGYTGTDVFPISVTPFSGATFNTRYLSNATDSVGISGTVGITGTIAITGAVTNTNLDAMTFAVVDTNKALRVTDVASTATAASVSTVATEIAKLTTAFGNASLLDGTNVNVSVTKIIQPTGITSAKISVTATTTAATNLASFALQSGVHFKSDLVNTTSTIYIGTNAGVTNGTGYPLYNGDQLFIETDNTNKIWISSTQAGSTLYYIGT